MFNQFDLYFIIIHHQVQACSISFQIRFQSFKNYKKNDKISKIKKKIKTLYKR